MTHFLPSSRWSDYLGLWWSLVYETSNFVSYIKYSQSDLLVLCNQNYPWHLHKLCLNSFFFVTLYMDSGYYACYIDFKSIDLGNPFLDIWLKYNLLHTGQILIRIFISLVGSSVSLNLSTFVCTKSFISTSSNILFVSGIKIYPKYSYIYRVVLKNNWLILPQNCIYTFIVLYIY